MNIRRDLTRLENAGSCFAPVAEPLFQRRCFISLSNMNARFKDNNCNSQNRSGALD